MYYLIMIIVIPTELQTSSTPTAPETTINTSRSCLYNKTYAVYNVHRHSSTFS